MDAVFDFSTRKGRRAVLKRVTQPAEATRIDGTVDEGKLVAAAQADPKEFGALYELYVDRVYRYAYRRVGTHHDAEDVTAQTFQQALAALPKYEWRGLPFGAWLFRIAANVINRRGRTGSREIPVEDVSVFRPQELSDDDPVDYVQRDEQSEELNELVSTLPPDQQRVFDPEVLARSEKPGDWRPDGTLRRSRQATSPSGAGQPSSEVQRRLCRLTSRIRLQTRQTA